MTMVVDAALCGGIFMVIDQTLGEVGGGRDERREEQEEDEPANESRRHVLGGWGGGEGKGGGIKTRGFTWYLSGCVGWSVRAAVNRIACESKNGAQGLVI